jgi:hypothetical protein
MHYPRICLKEQIKTTNRFSHEKPVSQPKFEPNATRMQVQNVSAILTRCVNLNIIPSRFRSFKLCLSLGFYTKVGKL